MSETVSLTPGDLEEIVTASERQTAVDGDDWLYDTDTGEVLGHVEVTERFTVDSASAADWALELRSRIEGNIAGIDARIKALNEQLQALRKQEVRKLSWWEYRFGGSLIAFARAMLAGTKSRTARFTWGKVAFRTTPGRTQILDMTHAVQFVKTWDPDAVKVVESVTTKDVRNALAAASAATGEDLSRSLPFLIESGPGESVTVSTGIETERRES
jgi:hypothetical protein